MTASNNFKTEIINIFIIQHNTGLVMGSYPKNKTEESGDKDIFGAMLTTIRSFGEDAFKKTERRDQQLAFIDYDNYKIFLQNHYNYYFVVVLKDAIETAEKNKLTRLYKMNKNITKKIKQYIFDQFKKYFI